jgi:hypothetical protein
MWHRVEVGEVVGTSVNVCEGWEGNPRKQRAPNVQPDNWSDPVAGRWPAGWRGRREARWERRRDRGKEGRKRKGRGWGRGKEGIGGNGEIGK